MRLRHMFVDYAEVVVLQVRIRRLIQVRQKFHHNYPFSHQPRRAIAEASRRATSGRAFRSWRRRSSKGLDFVPM